MSGTLQDEVDLIALPTATVIVGPSCHDEVYKKTDTDEWYSIASDAPWTCRALSHRGPFTVLRFGEPA
jgi:hypothetical protein